MQAGARKMAQVVQCLPSKCEDLNSSPSIVKKKSTKKRNYNIVVLEFYMFVICFTKLPCVKLSVMLTLTLEYYIEVTYGFQKHCKKFSLSSMLNYNKYIEK
jgi:hypothetical protein